MDFKKNINVIEKKIGYTFKDKSLLAQAFTRTSYCNEQNKNGRPELQSNEVLEFFGDSILSAVIVTFLMKDNTQRYDHGIKTALTEGDFSRIKSSLADKSNLSASIMKLGLEEFLIMGEGDKKQDIKKEASVREDLFESIIGAVYIDSGNDITRVIPCVTKMLDTSVYVNGSATAANAKGELQEWCADKSRRLPQPRYETVSVDGPEHKRVYKRACYIGDTVFGIGEGKNQKAADTAAAAQALKALKSVKASPVKPQENTDYHGLLRSYAAKHNTPPPEFHDLGETKASTDYAPEFMVECVCAGKRIKATARSKKEARILATKLLLEQLCEKEKSNSKIQPTKKSASKSKKNTK